MDGREKRSSLLVVLAESARAFLLGNGFSNYFLPIFSDICKVLNRWQNLIFVVSFVCLLGNLNEFLEYIIPLLLNKKEQFQLAVYYWDTIYDMMMNIAGVFGGFVAMRLNTKLS